MLWAVGKKTRWSSLLERVVLALRGDAALQSPVPIDASVSESLAILTELIDALYDGEGRPIVPSMTIGPPLRLRRGITTPGSPVEDGPPANERVEQNSHDGSWTDWAALVLHACKLVNQQIGLWVGRETEQMRRTGRSEAHRFMRQIAGRERPDVEPQAPKVEGSGSEVGGALRNDLDVLLGWLRFAEGERADVQAYRRHIHCAWARVQVLGKELDPLWLVGVRVDELLEHMSEVQRSPYSAVRTSLQRVSELVRQWELEVAGGLVELLDQAQKYVDDARASPLPSVSDAVGERAKQGAED
jgi:hypothetical protein